MLISLFLTPFDHFHPFSVLISRPGPSGIAGIPGSWDFKTDKIPGFLKLKSRDFSGFFVTMFWTPCNAIKPEITKIAKKSTHKDKYKIQKQLI